MHAYDSFVQLWSIIIVF